RVVLRELEGLQERVLRVLEPVELEVDEPQVVEERVGLGALGHELAIDLLGLLVLVLLEVDEPQEVQDLLVPRPQQVGLLQLPLRLLELTRLVEVFALVEVGEEQPLVEGAAGDGVAHRAVSPGRGSWCRRRLRRAGCGRRGGSPCRPSTCSRPADARAWPWPAWPRDAEER